MGVETRMDYELERARDGIGRGVVAAYSLRVSAVCRSNWGAEPLPAPDAGCARARVSACQVARALALGGIKVLIVDRAMGLGEIVRTPLPMVASEVG